MKEIHLKYDAPILEVCVVLVEEGFQASIGGGSAGSGGYNTWSMDSARSSETVTSAPGVVNSEDY